MSAFVTVCVLVTGAVLLGYKYRSDPQLPNRLEASSTVCTPEQRLSLRALTIILIATMTFRSRTASQIGSNPLDLAGLFRVTCIGVAALMAMRSLSVKIEDGKASTEAPTCLRAYAIYVVATLPGAAVAVAPLFVMFRVLELGTQVLAVYACIRAFNGDMRVPLKRCVQFVWFLGLSVIVGAVILPELALQSVREGLLPFRVEGVIPLLSANTVGALGALLFAIGLGSPRRSASSTIFGMSLVILSQYRTGYVALALVLLVWLASKQRVSSFLAVVIAAILMIGVVSTSEFENAWRRGDSESDLRGLNSRVTFWEAALDVTRRSPIIGTGLSSGTRFEVMEDRLGFGGTSTVHSTWVEALVGTGILGVLPLLVSLLVAVRGAVSRLVGSPVALMVLSVLTVRSITGSTIELPTVFSVVFLITAGLIVFQECRTSIVSNEIQVK